MPVKAPKTSRHREVERKFDVVESTVSPSFEGIAAVAHVEKSPTQIARCDVLRHAGTRPGAQQDHPAAPHRGPGRWLASEVAGRTRRPHRDPGAAGRVRSRGTGQRAERVAGCRAGDCPRPARSNRSRASPPSAKPRCCTASRAQRWPSSATTTSPPGRPALPMAPAPTAGRASVARVGTGTRRIRGET